MQYFRSITLIIVGIITLSFPINALDLSRYIDTPPGMYQSPDYTIYGWSPQGAFAYSYTLMLEGIGGTRYAYGIIDTVEDEIIFKEVMDVTPEHPDGDPEPIRQRFFTALNEAGIIQGKGMEFLPLPLRYQGDTYRVEVATEAEKDEERFYDRLSRYEVRVFSQNRGSKQITSGDDIMSLSMEAAGCFLSPFEARMLVVIMSETYVFEGTEGRFLFSGSHLKYGYH